MRKGRPVGRPAEVQVEDENGVRESVPVIDLSTLPSSNSASSAPSPAPRRAPPAPSGGRGPAPSPFKDDKDEETGHAQQKKQPSAAPRQPAAPQQPGSAPASNANEAGGAGGERPEFRRGRSSSPDHHHREAHPDADRGQQQRSSNAEGEPASSSSALLEAPAAAAATVVRRRRSGSPRAMRALSSAAAAPGDAGGGAAHVRQRAGGRSRSPTARTTAELGEVNVSVTQGRRRSSLRVAAEDLLAAFGAAVTGKPPSVRPKDAALPRREESAVDLAPEGVVVEESQQAKLRSKLFAEASAAMGGGAAAGGGYQRVPGIGRSSTASSEPSEARTAAEAAARQRSRRIKIGLAVLLLILAVAAAAIAVGVVLGRPSGAASAPRTLPRPTTQGNPIFSDDFDAAALDRTKWNVEVSAAGGGNWEFQVYVNRPENLYLRDSKLHIRPTLTESWFGDIRSKVLDLGPECTDPASFARDFSGCIRDPGALGVVNPVTSARINTKGKVSLRYGRVEVAARMPRGAWLWPAIWLMPETSAYGGWPQSGEIDVAESYGNAPGADPAARPGTHVAGSTLHWGPPGYSAWRNSHSRATRGGGATFADDFLTFGLVWNDQGLWTYYRDAAGVEKEVMNFPFPEDGLWSLGDRGCEGDACKGWGWPRGISNVWAGRPKSAPFDQKFYLIINLAVGGTNGYWDAFDGKPWSNDAKAMRSFYEAKGSWWPEWQASGDSAELQVESVKVWEF